MVGEIVRNRPARQIAAGYPFLAEKHVFSREIPAQITLGNDARRHVPVNRACAAVRFLDTISVSIVGVGVTSSAGEAIFLVVRITGPSGRIMGHVAGCVPSPGSSGQAMP